MIKVQDALSLPKVVEVRIGADDTNERQIEVDGTSEPVEPVQCTYQSNSLVIVHSEETDENELEL